MKIVLKILAVPIMCLLALTVAFCSLVLIISGVICWFLVVAAGIGGVVLFFTHHSAGAIAFLIIAYLVSPYGIPAFIAWLVSKLNYVRCSLKEYILG